MSVRDSGTTGAILGLDTSGVFISHKWMMTGHQPGGRGLISDVLSAERPAVLAKSLRRYLSRVTDREERGRSLTDRGNLHDSRLRSDETQCSKLFLNEATGGPFSPLPEPDSTQGVKLTTCVCSLKPPPELERISYIFMNIFCLRKLFSLWN